MWLFLLIWSTFVCQTLTQSVFLPFGPHIGDSFVTPSDYDYDEYASWLDCSLVNFGVNTFNFFQRNYSSGFICNPVGVFIFNCKTVYRSDPFLYDCDVLFSLLVLGYGPGSNITTYYRLETRSVILRQINDLLVSTKTVGSFEASWAFIATWDWRSVHISPPRLFQMTQIVDLTFQLVLFCGHQKSNSCHVLYSYARNFNDTVWNEMFPVGWVSGLSRKIQGYSSELTLRTVRNVVNKRLTCWVFSFIPGCEGRYDGSMFNNSGVYYQIPNRGVASLPSLSNVDIPGTFLFEVSGEVPVMKTYPILDMDPKLVYIYSENRTFTMSGLFSGNHSLDPNATFEVLFIGESYSVRMPATFHEIKAIITGLFPFWTKKGDVSAYLLTNNQQASEAMKVKFISKFDRFNPPKSLLIASKNNNSHETKLQWAPFKDSKEVVPHILEVSDRMEGLQTMEDPFMITRKELISVPNNGSYSITISSRNFVFIQLIPAEKQNSCQNPKTSKSLIPCNDEVLMTEIPIMPTAQPSCRHWLQEESGISPLGNWFDVLNVIHGCPRKPDSGWAVLETDAYFAREEVENGLHWKYDPCCSHVKSYPLEVLSFCTNCEFNEGAQFCIISRPIKTWTEQNGKMYLQEPSNQCCYNADGSLIVDPKQGAGRASKEINSPYNAIAHYKSDIAPYLSCCKGRKSTAEECETFLTFRPSVIGSYYAPSYITMTVVERDPHFRTLDGFRYTFNGLGVYTLLECKDPFVEVQVSMRRMGDGTVLSGFALKGNQSVLEGYLPSGSNELEVKINKKQFQLHEFTEIEIEGIEIREIASTELIFMLVNSSLSIKVIITDSSILNIAAIPPLYMVDDVTGLLGDFDGKPENDLIARNGSILPTTLTMKEIHDNFGESWKVPEDDWLFSVDFALDILRDIELGLPYEALYEPTFLGRQEEADISDACDGDKTCILDVSLTKNFVFANTTKTIKKLVEKVETIAVEYQETKKTVVQEVREKKKRAKETPKKKSESSKGYWEGPLKAAVAVVIFFATLVAVSWALRVLFSHIWTWVA